MRRILIGLIALALLAGGGWLGFNLYVQHRATAEVEAAFDQIRSRGGKASHGGIAFDLMTRTLTIEDIAVESGQQLQASVKIAGIKAVGVRELDEMRVSADSIELSGAEFGFEVAEQANLKAIYKAPQITVRDYSGAIRIQGAPTSDSLIDMYRFALAQFTGVTASSLVVPTVAVTVNPGSSAPGSGDITYSGLAIENINRGKIDVTRVDRAAFTFNVQQPGRPDKLTFEFSNLNTNGFDATALVAALDPQKANDDSYHRVYRQISAGPYVMTSAQGLRAQVDRISIDDIALQPSRFRLAEILALLPKDQSAAPTPAQAREMLEKLAGLYEGLSVGKVEVGNLSVGTPQGTAKLNAIRYGQDEFAIEGLDMPATQGRLKTERLALKSFSAANLMRWAAQFSDPAQRPAPDQLLALFRVLEGIEIKGMLAPYPRSKKVATIDTLSVNWGQLVGSIPSKAHVVAKMIAPTDSTEPDHMPLIAAGIDKLAIDLDLGAAWTESSNSFALAPATLDIGGVARAQLRVALGNVPRGLFSADPAQVMGQAAQVEASAVEFSLRDNGGVDSAVTQYARGYNVSRDAARQALADSVRVQREQIAAANPDAGALVDALASFVETPGQTLAIKLTPRAKVPLMQLMQLIQADPESALAQFRIEASTGL
jgi:hypothetical protein